MASSQSLSALNHVSPLEACTSVDPKDYVWGSPSGSHQHWTAQFWSLALLYSMGPHHSSVFGAPPPGLLPPPAMNLAASQQLAGDSAAAPPQAAPVAVPAGSKAGKPHGKSHGKGSKASSKPPPAPCHSAAAGSKAGGQQQHQGQHEAKGSSSASCCPHGDATAPCPIAAATAAACALKCEVQQGQQQQQGPLDAPIELDAEDIRRLLDDDGFFQEMESEMECMSSGASDALNGAAAAAAANGAARASDAGQVVRATVATTSGTSSCNNNNNNSGGGECGAVGHDAGLFFSDAAQFDPLFDGFRCFDDEMDELDHLMNMDHAAAPAVPAPRCSLAGGPAAAVCSVDDQPLRVDQQRLMETYGSTDSKQSSMSAAYSGSSTPTSAGPTLAKPSIFAPRAAAAVPHLALAQQQDVAVVAAAAMSRAQSGVSCGAVLGTVPPPAPAPVAAAPTSKAGKGGSKASKASGGRAVAKGKSSNGVQKVSGAGSKQQVQAAAAASAAAAAKAQRQQAAHLAAMPSTEVCGQHSAGEDFGVLHDLMGEEDSRCSSEWEMKLEPLDFDTAFGNPMAML